MNDPLVAETGPPVDCAPSEAKKTTPPNTPVWTYPTRMCRICHEDVAPSVSMYPPGLPPSFQRPIVEYRNEDEYGRLIRPCKCRGGMRYIHELCLKRSRIDSVRPGSLWKCHECGHQFNFKRLTLQRYLGSTLASATLTILVMILTMFMLGFIADPIINLYVDPYDTLVGNEDFWSEIEIQNANEGVSGWSLHFLKGLVSMGLVGFLKTALLNPFQWWNLRGTGWISARSNRTAATGRDRAANISWIAVIIGISSAFYFFYQWVQTIIGRTLQRIGNNIVDTQLAGDDEDLKAPPGWKHETAVPIAGENSNVSSTAEGTGPSASAEVSGADLEIGGDLQAVSKTRPLALASEEDSRAEEHVLLGDRHSAPGFAFTSALDRARDQEWSFVDL